MPYLEFIADADLEAEVLHLITTAQNAQSKAPKKFNTNVIDPFAALFEMSGFDLSHNDWYQNELIRQSQKTLQNQVGEFHQKILGHVEGWKDLGKGNIVDLVNQNSQIIAEVKNKYNTVSGGKLAELYSSLEGLVMPKTSAYKGYVAYYVTVIPKKPERHNICFTPSDKDKGEKCRSNELIRAIDGASFYELVTGHKNALAEVYAVLPVVISSLMKEHHFSKEDKDALKTYFNIAFGSG